MTIRSALVAAGAHLPARTDGVVVARDLGVPMRDGTILRADLWRPRHDDGARPLVIVRTPYGRAGLDLVGRLFAERGFPVIIQSSRGTFGSGGRFVPFVDEVGDGADLVAWLDEQPWARRPWALLGASYLGYTSYTLLQNAPERVVALALAVTAADFHTGVMYPDEAIGSETALIWISGLLTQELPALRRLRATRGIRRRMRSALLSPPERADAVLLGSAYPPYQDWVRHDRPDDPWWDALDRRAERPALPPATLVAGWYDPFLTAQLDDHAVLRENDRPARLVVGPWTHGSPGIVGALVRESLALLADPPAAGGARVHDTGTGSWHELAQWPPRTAETRLFLTGGGRLRDRMGAELDASWIVDPADPPPAAGGRGLNPTFAGRRRQRARERRADVFTTTSGRLGRAVTLAGRPVVELHVARSSGAQEWFVRLCDVDRWGVSRNVCDGYLRADAGEEQTLRIALAPAAHTFRRGHRLRLQVSGSGFPFHPAPPDDTGRRRVLSRVDAPSGIVLPRLVGGWGEGAA